MNVVKKMTEEARKTSENTPKRSEAESRQIVYFGLDDNLVERYRLVVQSFDGYS